MAIESADTNTLTVKQPSLLQHEVLPETQLPFISVVVPVRNEERYIAETLTDVLAQDYATDRVEVLVVDGESDDRTREIVSEFSKRDSRVKLLPNPKRWSSSARNVGAKSAEGDIVLVVDGHCEMKDSQYLMHLAKAFDKSDAHCVGRPQPLDGPSASTLQLAIAAARSSVIGHHPDSFIYSSGEQFVPAHSVAVAYKKSVFEEIGYFDETFDACEDVEFNHRVDKAGLTCFFTDKVQLRYHPRTSLKRLYRQMIRYGRGRIRLLRKHKDTFSFKTLVPAMFVAGCVIGAITMWFSPILSTIYLSVLGVYAAIVLGASVFETIRHRKLSLLPWLPAVFAMIHFGAGTGLLIELLFGSPKKK